MAVIYRLQTTTDCCQRIPHPIKNPWLSTQLFISKQKLYQPDASAAAPRGWVSACWLARLLPLMQQPWLRRRPTTAWYWGFWWSRGCAVPAVRPATPGAVCVTGPPRRGGGPAAEAEQCWTATASGQPDREVRERVPSTETFANANQAKYQYHSFYWIM